MLLARHGIYLGFEHAQGADDAWAGLVRLDDVIHKSALGGNERIGETLVELGDLSRALAGRQIPVKNVDGAFGAHDGDFGRRPSEVDVGPDVFGAHNTVSPTIRLARDDGDLGNGGLRKSVKQLGAVADDAAKLLVGAGEKSGHVLEGHKRDVEGVAEAHEARALIRRVDVEAA